MPNLITGLIVDRVDLVDEGANTASFIKLFKRKETTTTMGYDEILKSMKPEHVAVIEAEMVKAKTEVPTEVAKQLSDTQAELETTKTELTKAKEIIEKKKPEEENFEDVLKGLDPAVQKVVKSLQAQKEAAEQVAKQLSDKREHDEAVEKARILKALPVEEDQLIEVVKGVSPEIYEILKKAATAIEESDLFEEIGKGKGDKGSTDAWSKIEKKATELAAKDNISIEKAISSVITDEPELYKEYLRGGAK